MTRETPRVRFEFLISPASDGIWYIGSALAGFVYVAMVLSLGRGLEDPIHDPFYRLNVGPWSWSLTLGLLVVASWSLLIDAPHVWATLARTWLDPDDWSERKGVLLWSTVWFAVGPLAILGPYVLGTFLAIPPALPAVTAVVFFVLFRLWAYYHVVRQHWGFLVLYKRKNDDWADPLENRADLWFFNAALYLPLLLFLTAPWYGRTGMPEMGLSRPLMGDLSISSILRPGLLVLYPLAVAAYSWFQIHRYRRGITRNGPKLLLLAAIVPLHLVVFSHPLLALFVVPIVTVGHNLQYHRIVWSFGRSKYSARTERPFRFARAAFRSRPVYFGLGLLFTFLLYQGPFIEGVKTELARWLGEWVLPGIGLVAGTDRPDSVGIGARVASALFLGWAMQHYYLDSKIWRVRSDRRVARYLDSPGVAESGTAP